MEGLFLFYIALSSLFFILRPMHSSYELSLYDYELPPELIAQNSVQPHHDSRLLAVDRYSGNIIRESTCFDLDTLIPENRVLFFNNSRVLRARLALPRVVVTNVKGTKKEVTNIEIFFLSLESEEIFEALVRPGKIFQDGTTFSVYGRTMEVMGTTEAGRVLRLHGGGILEFFESHGSLPLPPYISYSKEKEKDYQSIYAKELGSVAAPTASLHFTKELLEKLPHSKEMITLHVGLGTFQGVKTEDIREFQIHEELVEVPLSLFSTIATLRIQEKYILAVGTTVCRSLESLPYLWIILSPEIQSSFSQDTQDFWNSRTTLGKEFVTEYTRTNNRIHFSTRIYIYEGFHFQIIEDLITNFHLPKSSLLMLVSSLLTRKKVMELYEYAIEKKYRFFSF